MKWLLTLILISSCWALGSSPALRVIIDPGHGGFDTGAVRSSVRESDISLKVAQELTSLLSKNSHFKTTLTRNKNKNISLKQRAKIAKKNNGELFISIHVNASKDRRAKGMEVYFQNQLPPDEEAMFLANKENQSLNKTNYHKKTQWLSRKNDIQNILNDLDRNYYTQQSYIISQHFLENWQAPIRKRKRSIRQAPFYLVSEVSMPSVLVELGFLSNPKDFKTLKTSTFHKQAAKNIYVSLLKYKETLDKSQ